MTPRSMSPPPPPSFTPFDPSADLDPAMENPFPPTPPPQTTATASSAAEGFFPPVATTTAFATPTHRATAAATRSREQAATLIAEGVTTARGALSDLLSSPLQIPRRVFSSSTLQIFTLIVTYAICLTTLWVIFCGSYALSFYDDTRTALRTSPMLGRIKAGVRERLSMVGEDWQGLLKRLFDSWPADGGVGGTNTGHLGGEAGAGTGGGRGGSTKSMEEEWEEWWRGMMVRFMTVVAGQEATNRFRQTHSA